MQTKFVLLIIMIVAPLLTGCLAIGDNARVQMFERGEVQPSLAFSLGSRTQAGAAASQDTADAWQDSAMEGGGKVDAKLSRE